MAEVLPEWPRKPKTLDRYLPYFDGQCWKLSPEEFDYEIEDIKAFIAHMKVAAAKNKIYIRSFITADNHVIIQKQPDNYVPRLRGKIAKKVKTDAANT